MYDLSGVAGTVGTKTRLTLVRFYVSLSFEGRRMRDLAELISLRHIMKILNLQ